MIKNYFILLFSNLINPMIKFELNVLDFPLLNSIKPENIQGFCLDIFKTGYNIKFPNISDQSDTKTDLQEIKMNLSSHFGAMSKLINITSNSALRGQLGENYIQEFFQKNYPHISFTHMGKTAHCGDAWLDINFGKENKKIMIECKNYNVPVKKDELEKLKSDMITNTINFAIYISFNSGFTGLNDVDIVNFENAGINYWIVCIANVFDNPDKIHMAISLTLALLKNVNNSCKTNNFEKKIIELKTMITKNHTLRDNYLKMENIIQNQLDTFYSSLRDFQYSIEKIISEIIAIDDNIDDDNITLQILEKYKDRKYFNILSKVLDKLISIGYSIKENGENVDIYKMSDLVGSIKLIKTKFSVILNGTILNFDNVNNIKSSFEKLC